jgi:hypothetical protein
MEIYTRALRCIVRPGRSAFKVTPKQGRDAGGLAAVRRLHLVLLCALLLAGGTAMRLLDLVGAGPLPDLPGIATVIVPLLGLFELRRVLRTLVSVGRRRQRRLVYRFEGDAPADCYSTDGHVAGRLVDASPAGVGLVTDAALPIGATPSVHLELRGVDGQTHAIAAQVEVRSCRPSDERYLIGATIVDIDADSRMWLMEWCYVVCSHERLRGGPSTRAPEVEPIVIQLGEEEPALALAG